MQLPDQLTEISRLENELKSLTNLFDHAINTDQELCELKRIFHEMKKIRVRLDELTRENSNA